MALLLLLSNLYIQPLLCRPGCCAASKLVSCDLAMHAHHDDKNHSVSIQFAYGCTNFVGGITASRPHRRTDSTVRPTPGTVRLMYEYSWYEVPYWYETTSTEYLLPATYRQLPTLPCPALTHLP